MYIGILSDGAIRPSVCLSHSPGKKGRFRQRIWLEKKTIILKVEIADQRGPTTTGSGRNGLDLEKKLRRQYLHNEDR